MEGRTHFPLAWLKKEHCLKKTFFGNFDEYPCSCIIRVLVTNCPLTDRTFLLLEIHKFSTEPWGVGNENLSKSFSGNLQIGYNKLPLFWTSHLPTCPQHLFPSSKSTDLFFSPKGDIFRFVKLASNLTVKASVEETFMLFHIPTTWYLPVYPWKFQWLEKWHVL